ncbi:FG-GAP repeat domain-containing protein [Luteolibacter marinus]|uniref:FG-GAP repeat domain-containing protein n=1 Tax=Luteolibacter marinus TaxID=2776705 RepID=UPI001868CA26|nr:VCBS repeat-containing protein [Luteolibacter marinus]
MNWLGRAAGSPDKNPRMVVSCMNWQRVANAISAAVAIQVSGAQVVFGPSKEIGESITNGIGFAVATDVDDDGDLDSLVAERLGVRVLWWENDGAGSFSDRREWTWGGPDWEVVGLVDWDLDGLLDVWIQHQPQDTYDDETGSVLRRYLVARNDGSGLFEDPVVVFESEAYWSFGETLIADIDGNYRPDILSPVRVMTADPSGAFTTPPVPLPEDEWGERWSARSEVSLADFGGDGVSDLLVESIYTDGKLLRIRNLGAGGFAEPETLLPTGSVDGFPLVRWFCVHPSDAAPPEIVIVEEDVVDDEPISTLRFFEAGTDATLTEVASLPLANGTGEGEVNWHSLRCEPATGRLFIASITFGSAESPVDPVTKLHEVTRSGATVTLVEIVEIEGYADTSQVAVEEMNGDGFPDLFLPVPRAPAVFLSSPDLVVWHAGTAAGFSELRNEITRSPYDPKILSVADIDGDGDTDLLVGSAGLAFGPTDRIELLRNTGGPGDFERVPIPLHRDAIDVVATVDLEGEFLIFPPEGHEFLVQCQPGKADFLVQTFEFSGHSRYEGTLRFEWMLQDGTGGFHFLPLWSEPADGLALASHVDWDRDGTKDVLYESFVRFVGSQGLRYRRGGGDTFAAPVAVTNQSSLSFGPLGNRLTTGAPLIDLDWDGDPDLLLAGNLFGTYSSYWAENDGSGVISAIRKLPYFGLQITPDLDGDGHPDLLVDEQILLARSGVTFDPLPVPGAYFNYWDGNFADLDADGDADYLIAGSPGGISSHRDLVWWENRGDGDFSRQQPFPAGSPIVPAEWGTRRQRLLGDMDGDGTPDLVVASGPDPRLEWIRISRTPEPAAFTAWMDGRGLRGNSASPVADWDLDGSPNWDEFAFGSDPAVPDPGHPGRPRMERSPGGFVFTFQRRTDAASFGLSYPTRRSIDLLEWNPWMPPIEMEASAGGYERVRLPVTPSLDREFFDVEVSPPADP